MQKSSLISNENNKSSASNFGQNRQPLFFKPLIQPKLTINQPNDIYEQEADAMAGKVMRMPDNEKIPQPFFKPVISSIQRKCEHCEEEEEKKLQRKKMDDEETTVNGELEKYVTSLSGAGQPLPGEVRNFYEPRFGYDFSNVKIHTDSIAAGSAQSINALAYTAGNNIVFNNGQYSPDTDSGKRLLGHELTHVVQQNAMMTRPGSVSKNNAFLSYQRNIQRKVAGEHVIQIGKFYVKKDFRSIAAILNMYPKDDIIAQINTMGGGNNYILIYENGIGYVSLTDAIEANYHEEKYKRLIIKGTHTDEDWKNIIIHLSHCNEDFITAMLKQMGGYNRTKFKKLYENAKGRYLNEIAPQSPLLNILETINKFPQSELVIQQPATPVNPDAVPPTPVTLVESASVATIEELEAYPDNQIETTLYEFTNWELVSVRNEASVKQRERLLELIDKTIEYRIEDAGIMAIYSSFIASVELNNLSEAVTLISALKRSEIGLFTSQLSASQRQLLHDEAAGNQHVLIGMEKFETDLMNTEQFAEYEENYSKYKAALDTDLSTATVYLNKLSDEMIYLELNGIGDDEKLRSLRKAADKNELQKISTIISTILAAKDKTELAVENLLYNKWTYNFIMGLGDAGLDEKLGDAWESFRNDTASVSNYATFYIGCQTGIVAGIGIDIYNNIAGLVTIILKLGEYQIKIYTAPDDVFTEVAEVLKKLFKTAMSALDAREFGYAIGRLLSKEIQTDFIAQTPFWKGYSIGKIIGIIATEIALLFIGIGEVTAAVKAIRGTKIFMEIENVLSKSKILDKIVSGVKKFKLGKLADPDFLKAGKLGKAETITDIGQTEKLLSEMAELEKTQGALITKEMEPIEQLMIKEKVKTPENIKIPDAEFQTTYIAEVKVGEHTYRMKPDGTWCRFSYRRCGYGFGDDVSNSVKSIFGEHPLEQAINETTKNKALGIQQPINKERGIIVHQFAEAIEDWLKKKSMAESMSRQYKKLIKKGSLPENTVAEFEIELANGKKYRMDRVCFDCDPPKIIEIKSDAPGQEQSGLDTLNGRYKPLMDDLFKDGLPGGRPLPAGGFEVEVVVYDRKLAEKILYGK